MTALVVNAQEREAIFAVRMLVFVEEQGVPPEEELDAYDLTAAQFLIRRTDLPADDPDAIVGTARLIDKGAGVGKVGRVAILKEFRGKGVGAQLMRSVESYAREQGFARLILDAQCSAISFYERLGYVGEGDIFLDCDIEHIFMAKALR